MSRRRSPRRGCLQLSLRKGPPHPPMRDGWRARRFCNRPTTHEVRWFAGFVTVGDGFEEDRREVWKPIEVRVCEIHARRIERYQRSIGVRVGVYRYRRLKSGGPAADRSTKQRVDLGILKTRARHIR